VSEIAHYMTNVAVVEYDGAGLAKMASVCGCPDHPCLIGTGHTLTECANDLQAKFDAHVKAAR
jgi:hypothetical protein